MSSTEPKPLRADARRNRERIVDAARDLFVERGLSTQMDDIARAAGVGVGTVYRHFPTKSALLGELMAAKFRRNADVARRWAASEDGWEALEGFLRETFAAMASDASLQQRMVWVDDGEAAQRAEEERLRLAGIVGGMIERAQRQGRMRADFTVQDIPSLMSAVGAVLSGCGRHGGRVEPFIEVVIDGLRAH